MPKYILDPCVEEELWNIWTFIAQDNQDAAARVIEAAYETFKMLAANPDMGRPRKFSSAKLRDIRSWRIVGFENYLIFYRGITNGIQVNHIYHGSRNLEALFDDK